MKRLLVALQFLTTLPIKIRSQIQPQDFGRSLLYFPIVGIFIGGVLALFSFFAAPLPALVRGALILVAYIFITGAVHLDGFADTCDGFYAGSNKEDVLKIMRDSRIGTMGAIGIFCILLLKFVLIVSIPQNMLWRSLLPMTTFSRWSQALACCMSTYARQEGKAKFFVEYARPSDIIAGAAITFILFLLLAGISGVMLFIASFIAVFSFIIYTRARIGGMTGDTIGAVSEIADVTVLFFIVFKGIF